MNTNVDRKALKEAEEEVEKTVGQPLDAKPHNPKPSRFQETQFQQEQERFKKSFSPEDLDKE